MNRYSNNISRIAYVTRQPPEIVKVLREEYKQKGLSLTKGLDKKLFDTHHILGLSLGGQNIPENLVLMRRDEHAILHKYFIDPQVADMKVGESRLIFLPVSYDLRSRSFLQYAEFMASYYGADELIKAKMLEKVKER